MDLLEEKYLGLLQDIFSENSSEDIINWTCEYDAARVSVKGLETRYQEWLLYQQKQACPEEKKEMAELTEIPKMRP